MLGRHRAVRWPNPAQSRARPAGQRRQHYRHLATEHRARRGSRDVRRHAAQARHSATAQRPCHQRDRGARGVSPTELPGACASVIRARRPGDADRVLRRRAAPLHAHRRRGLAGAASVGGQIPRGRHRGGRRLHRRRRPARRSRQRHRGHRRYARARGVCGRAFRRCRDGPPAAHALRRAHGHSAPLLRRHGPRAESDRADERAVRHQGRHRVRARGQPARVTHRAVRQQGDRPTVGQAGGQGDDRSDAQGTGLHW